MKAAESTGDTAEQARLLAMILEIAQGKGQRAELAEAGLLSAISQDLEKAIKKAWRSEGPSASNQRKRKPVERVKPPSYSRKKSQIEGFARSQ